MAKVGLKDVAQALAKKKNIDVVDAEKYIDEFFSLIEDSLVLDKVVKVKGLGTFKLVDVRDRESVDVNTGDRVIIDGHSKISFQPEANLKDLVNKPFSQFETVILNDGVDFDNELVNEQEEETEPLRQQYSKGVAQSKVAAVLEDAASNCMPAINEESESDKLPEDIESDFNTGKIELHTEPRENLDSKGNVTISTSLDGEDKIVTNDIEKTSCSDNQVSAEQGCDVPGGEELSLSKKKCDNEKREKKTSFFKIALECLAIVIIFVVIFFAGFFIGKNKNTPQVSGQKTIPYKERRIAKTKVETNKGETRKQDIDSTKNNEAEYKVYEEISASEEENDIDNKNAKQLDELTDARKLVHTGAYIISGTARVVIMNQNMTLKKLARIYLGDGMECYIIVHNGKAKFKPGESINIPKLKLKKKVSNKKVS